MSIVSIEALRLRRPLFPDILRRTNPNTPLVDNPNLRDKGFLLLSIPNGQENDALFLGGLTTQFNYERLGIDAKKPDLSRFIIWDPKIVAVTSERYNNSPKNPGATNDAEIRARILEKLGYQTVIIKYPDQTVLIRISEPGFTAFPEVDTSQLVQQP